MIASLFGLPALPASVDKQSRSRFVALLLRRARSSPPRDFRVARIFRIRQQEPECGGAARRLNPAHDTSYKDRDMNALQRERSALTAAEDPRWANVVARDRSADGSFVYSVATTGIYCRPSCPARQARPENVRFHQSCAEAERAGFRACRRCRPDRQSPAEEQAAKIAEICRRIETADEMPGLDALARQAGLSPHHFHRVFRAVTGVTPKAYAAAHRAKRVRNELRRSQTVTEAIFDAGFNSGGRFYETSRHVLGMTPTDYRAGGARAEIRFAVGECSLGSILVAKSQKGVCAILLGDD